MDNETGIAIALMVLCAITAIGLMVLFQPAADAVQAVADAADASGRTRITIGDPHRPDECGNATNIGDGACNKQVYDVSPGAAGLAFLGITLPISAAVFAALFAVACIAFAAVRN